MAHPDLNRYDVIEATFKPRRSDDLKPGSEEWIGRRLTWIAGWEIEDGDYVGEFACSLHGAAPEPHPPFVWVPSGDLTDITILSSIED